MTDNIFPPKTHRLPYNTVTPTPLRPNISKTVFKPINKKRKDPYHITSILDKCLNSILKSTLYRDTKIMLYYIDNNNTQI